MVLVDYIGIFFTFPNTFDRSSFLMNYASNAKIAIYNVKQVKKAC
jgi:hypothetical protein